MSKFTVRNACWVLVLAAGAAAGSCGSRPTTGAALPNPVWQTIDNTFPGVPPASIAVRRRSWENQSVYQADFFHGGRDHDILIDDHGRIVQWKSCTTFRPLPDIEKNQQLAAAADQCENLAEAALAGQSEAARSDWQLYQHHLPVLSAYMPSPAYAELTRTAQTLESGLAAHRRLAAAASALDSYRLLVHAQDPRYLPIPRDVALLDAAGLSLRREVLEPSVRWDAVRQTALAAQELNKNLQPWLLEADWGALLETTIQGLLGAAQDRSPDRVRFGARVLLDQVDLLEDYFMRLYQERITPAHAARLAKERFHGEPVAISRRVLMNPALSRPVVGYRILLVTPAANQVLGLSLRGDKLFLQDASGQDVQRIRAYYDDFKQAKKKLIPALSALGPVDNNAFRSAEYAKNQIRIEPLEK